MISLITKRSYFILLETTNRPDVALRIYVELADQYKMVDAASNITKRNILAQHVHEIVDILEQKVRLSYT